MSEPTTAPVAPKNVVTAKTVLYAAGTAAAVAAAPQLAAAIAAKPVLAAILNSVAIFLLRLVTNQPVSFDAPILKSGSGQ